MMHSDGDQGDWPDADYLESGDGLARSTHRAELSLARQLLAEPETWSSPPPRVELAVIDGIAAESRGVAPPSQVRRWGQPVLAAAAVLAVLAAFASGWLLADRNTSSADVEVVLAATDLAPEASGRARLLETPSGIEIELTIEDLAAAPDGTYYQGWLKTDDGVGVTIGTFHLRGEDEPVVLWSGLDLDDVVLITVTVQTVDGGPASSGNVVLKAPLDTD